jgi:EAL and modified HD-GYP domain-containing signal transduction protein
LIKIQELPDNVDTIQINNNLKIPNIPIMTWKLNFQSSKKQAEGDRQLTQGARPLPTDTVKIVDEQVFVGRQPVFTQTEQVIGYVLSTPKCDIGIDSEVPFNTCNSARLIMNVLNNFGLDQLVGDKLAFIPISLGAFAANAIGILPTQKTVLEIHPISVPESELGYVCEAVHEKGYRFALNDYELNDGTKGAFLNATYAAFDIGLHGVDAAIKQAASLRHLPLQRIAWNIHSKKDFDACKHGAFDLFEGNIFSQPEAWSMNRVDPSNLRVIEIFNLIMNQADLDVIDEAFKHDVGLSYSLLTYVNSVGVGLPHKTQSIRHALMLLGHDYLARWVSLLIFAGVDTRAAQRVLLNTALIRARLTELLGQTLFTKKEADQLFIVGMFSLLDTLFGQPMEQVLSHMSLPADVVDALVGQTGKFRPFLELAISFEGQNFTRAEKLCGDIGTDITAASYAHLSAIEWAQQMG